MFEEPGEMPPRSVNGHQVFYFMTLALIAVVFELFVFDIPPLLNWRQRLYFIYLFHHLNIILVPT